MEYRSLDQTAVLGEHYDPVAGSLSFAPGERERGRLQRDESGSRVFGSYQTGDRFRIPVEAGEVSYWRNRERLYVSSVPSGGPLHVDTALYTPTATLDGVVATGR